VSQTQTRKEAGKREAVVGATPATTDHNIIGVSRRFHTAVTLQSGTGVETYADLDTGAECDIISWQFAKDQQLKTSKLRAPGLAEWTRKYKMPQYGVYEVPLRLTDSRGTTRTMVRLCAAVDRDPRPEGSPILLSMTTMEEYHIFLAPAKRQWWFEVTTPRFQVEDTKKFQRTCRKSNAKAYALFQANDEVVTIGALVQPLYPPSPTRTRKNDEPGVEEKEEKVREQYLAHEIFIDEKSSVLPRRKATDHMIEIEEGETPPHGPIYPLSPAELKTLRAYLDEALAKGWIQESKSPAGAPILFVPKKDGSLRLCVDYRGLNKITKKNRYPLPLISEIMDRVTGASIFSKIDVKDAYYRIRIKEGDEWKTAFRTRYGHYEYLVMPFGLTNAPATFQSYINKALGDLVDTVCVVYLDDVLIFSKDEESHKRHVTQVLDRLQEAELYAKPSKCTFHQTEVEFLGFIISTQGIAMDPARVATVAEWEEPKTYREIQVFLGFCNFYRRFIEGYSKIARPLNNLLKGSKDGRKPGTVELNKVERAAFNLLKQAFQEAPLLRHFDVSKPVRMETDASKFAMAGILSQPDDQGRWHPVAFWSRTFKDAELNYGTPDQEMLAIVESFKHWRHYVEGAEGVIEVLTDHQNLQSFMKQTKINGRQARWCMFLSPYDFVIKHRAGKSNPADAPSRRPDYEREAKIDPQAQARDLLSELQTHLVGAAHVDWIGHLPLRDKESRSIDRPEQGKGAEVRVAGNSPVVGVAQIAAMACRTIGTVGREHRVPRSAVRTVAEGQSVYGEPQRPLLQLIREVQESDPLLKKENLLQVEEGEKPIWIKGEDGLFRYRGKIYIPDQPALKNELMMIYHDDPMAGHFGNSRTRQLLQRKFYWPQMDRDTSEYVKGCRICQGVVPKRHRPYGKLDSLPFPSRPWAEISMDFITGLPEVDYEGQVVDAILAIVDRFTKYTILIPVPTSITAAELAQRFHKEVEMRFGPPRGAITDRGSLFTSSYWSDFCHALNIKRRLSTAFHPQTDGQTERMNQTIEHYLRCFCTDNQSYWPRLLATAQFSMNNATSATTGQSPHMLLMGYEPDFHVSIGDDAPEEGVPEAKARVEKLLLLRKRAMIQWKVATERQARNFNKAHQPQTFKRGELVGLATRNLRVKKGEKKLMVRYIGPLRVLERIGSQAYRVALPTKYHRIHNVFHVSLLEPWHIRPQDQSQAEEVLVMPDLEEDENEWEIQAVTDYKKVQKKQFYLVKWKGWPPEYNEWIEEANMGKAQEVISDYWKDTQRKKSQQKKGPGRPRKTSQEQGLAPE
jgi:transposase InsO family protein